MGRRLWVFWGSLALFGVLASPAAALDIDDAERSVVRVVARNGPATQTGSGSVLNADGYILSNFHVVENARELAVHRSGSNQLVAARVVAVDRRYDLALLLAAGVGGKPVAFGPAPEKGDAVHTLGFPGGGDSFGIATDASYAGGEVSRFFRTERWVRPGVQLMAIQHTAAINPGNSGGPLVNDCGAQIGVNTVKVSDASDLFFASYVDAALPLLRSNGVSVRSAGPCVISAGAPVAGSDPNAGGSRDQAEERARSAELQAEGALRAAEDALRQAEDVSQEQQAQFDALMRNVIVLGSVLLVLVGIALAAAFRRPRSAMVEMARGLSRRVGNRRRGESLVISDLSTVSTDGFELLPDGGGAAIQVGGELVEAAGGNVTLGRLREVVDVGLALEDLSKRHARFSWREGAYEVEDLGTTNGTCVNDLQLSAYIPKALEEGDRVTLGEQVYVFRLRPQ